MADILSFLNRFSPLSTEAEKHLLRSLRQTNLKKGSQLLKEGQTCKSMMFLEQGTVRTYFYKDGKDITYWIYPHNSLFTNWSSFAFQTPSHEYIETTEDSSLTSISHKDWYDLLDLYPDIREFYWKFLESQLAMLDDFYRGYNFMTAAEKYEAILKVFPDIVLRSNLGHIASMLGISQETLSRIRTR